MLHTMESQRASPTSQLLTPMISSRIGTSSGRHNLERVKKESAVLNIQRVMRGYIYRGYLNDKLRLKLLNLLREWSHGNMLKLEKRRDLSDRSSQALLLNAIKIATSPSRPLYGLTPALKINRYIVAVTEKRKMIEGLHDEVKSEYIRRNKERAGMLAEDRWGNFRIRYDNVLKALIDQDIAIKKQAMERERLENIKRQIFEANKNIIEKFEEGGLRERMERETMFREEYTQRRREDQSSRNLKARDQLDKEQMTWEDGMGQKRRQAEREQQRLQRSVIEDRERIRRAKMDADKASLATNSKGVSYSSTGNANKLELALRERFRSQKAIEREERRSHYCQCLAQTIAFNPKVARLALASGVEDVQSFYNPSNFVTTELYKLHNTRDVNGFITALYQFIKFSQYRSPTGLNVNKNYSNLLKGEISLKHSGIVHPKLFNSNQRVQEAVELKHRYDQMNKTYYWWRKERRYVTKTLADGKLGNSNSKMFQNSISTTKIVSASDRFSLAKTDNPKSLSSALVLSTNTSLWDETELRESCREVRVIASIRLNNRWYRMNANYDHTALAAVDELGLGSPAKPLPKAKTITSMMEAVRERGIRRKNRFINETNVPGVVIPERYMQVAAWLTIPEELRLLKDKVNVLRLLVRQRLACYDLLRNTLAQFRYVHGQLVKTIHNLKVLKVPTRKQRLDLQDEAIRLELKLPKLRAQIIESCRLLSSLVVFNCIAYIDLLGIIRPHEVDDMIPAHTPEVVCNFTDYKFVGKALEDSSDEEPEEGEETEMDVIESHVKSVTDRLTSSNTKIVDLSSMKKKATIAKGKYNAASSRKSTKGKSEKQRTVHETDSYIPHSLFPVHPPTERSNDVQPVAAETLIRLDAERQRRESQVENAPLTRKETASAKKKHHSHHRHKDDEGEPESDPSVMKALFSKTMPGMGSTGPFAAVIDNVPSLYGVRGCGMYNKKDANEYDFVQWCIEILDWYSNASSNWFVKYEMLWKERHIVTCLSFVHRFRHLTHDLKVDDVMQSENSRVHKPHKPTTVYEISPSDADLTQKILYRSEVCDLLDLILSRADITVQTYDPVTQKQWSRVLTGYEADAYFGRHPGSLIARYMYRKGQYNENISLAKGAELPKDSTKTQLPIDTKKKSNLYATNVGHKHKIDRSKISEPITSTAELKLESVTHKEGTTGKSSIYDTYTDAAALLDHFQLITKDDLTSWHQSAFIKGREKMQPTVPVNVAGSQNADSDSKDPDSHHSISHGLGFSSLSNPLLEKIQSYTSSKSNRSGNLNSPSQSSRNNSPEKLRGISGGTVTSAHTVDLTSIATPDLSPTKVVHTTRKPHTVTELCTANAVSEVSVDVNFSVMKDDPTTLKHVNPALIVLCPSLTPCHNDKAEQRIVEHVTGSTLEHGNEELPTTGQNFVYYDIDIETSHYDESILNKLECKAMTRERAELLEFVNDVIVNKQGLQLYETYDAFKTEIHNKATLKTVEEQWVKEHPELKSKDQMEMPLRVNTGDDSPSLGKTVGAISPDKCVSSVSPRADRTATFPLVGKGADRDRVKAVASPTAPSAGDHHQPPHMLSTAHATASNSRGVARPKPKGLAHRLSTATAGAAKTPSNRPKVVLETAQVSYRLRINKLGASPGKFMKEIKTLDYWHCKAPGWMMPFYHWGTASAPEPFWRKLLLETEFHIGDGTGKYATMDVLNRKIDNIARNVLYHMKLKRYTYLAKLDIIKESTLLKLNQDCMEFEDARSGAAATYAREQKEKNQLFGRIFRVIDAVGRVLCFPCVSSSAAKIGVVDASSPRYSEKSSNPSVSTDKLVRALGSLRLRSTRTWEDNEPEEFIPSVREWKKQQARRLLQRPPPTVLNWEEITKQTDATQKTITLTAEAWAEIKVQASQIVRWEVPLSAHEASMTGSMTSGQRTASSYSSPTWRGKCAAWITDTVSHDGLVPSQGGKSFDRDDHHDPDPEVLLPLKSSGSVTSGGVGSRVVGSTQNDTGLRDDATTVNNDPGTNSNAFYPTVKEGWVCGGMTGVALMTRSVPEPNKYPRGTMWVSEFKFDSSRLDTCLKLVYANINTPQTAALVARVGFLTRPLCHNNVKKFANVVSESGRPLAGGRTYRHLSCEVPAVELPRLRDLTRSMLWAHVVNDRYDMKAAHFAVRIIQKLFYLFKAKQEIAKKKKAKEELKIRLKKEYEIATAKEKAARENEERTNRHRERSSKHSAKFQNDENTGNSTGFFGGISEKIKRKSQNDGNSVIESLLISVSGKYRGGGDQGDGNSSSSKRLIEADPTSTSFVGNLIVSMSGKNRGRINSYMSESEDDITSTRKVPKVQTDSSSIIGGFMSSLSGKYRPPVSAGDSPEKS